MTGSGSVGSTGLGVSGDANRGLDRCRRHGGGSGAGIAHPPPRRTQPQYGKHESGRDVERRATGPLRGNPELDRFRTRGCRRRSLGGSLGFGRGRGRIRRGSLRRRRRTSGRIAPRYARELFRRRQPQGFDEDIAVATLVRKLRHRDVDQGLPALQAFGQARHRLVHMGVGHREAIVAIERRLAHQGLRSAARPGCRCPSGGPLPDHGPAPGSCTWLVPIDSPVAVMREVWARTRAMPEIGEDRATTLVEQDVGPGSRRDARNHGYARSRAPGPRRAAPAPVRSRRCLRAGACRKSPPEMSCIEK